jgi:glucose-6-phosphate isomerase
MTYVVRDLSLLRPMGRGIGKQFAKKIEPELAALGPVATHDPSTNGLIDHYKRHYGRA